MNQQKFKTLDLDRLKAIVQKWTAKYPYLHFLSVRLHYYASFMTALPSATVGEPAKDKRFVLVFETIDEDRFCKQFYDFRGDISDHRDLHGKIKAQIGDELRDAYFERLDRDEIYWNDWQFYLVTQSNKGLLTEKDIELGHDQVSDGVVDLTDSEVLLENEFPPVESPALQRLGKAIQKLYHQSFFNKGIPDIMEKETLDKLMVEYQILLKTEMEYTKQEANTDQYLIKRIKDKNIFSSLSPVDLKNEAKKMLKKNLSKKQKRMLNIFKDVHIDGKELKVICGHYFTDPSAAYESKYDQTLRDRREAVNFLIENLTN